MNHQHFSTQISDYVLDLLPAAECQALERHIVGCAQCRQAIQRERHIIRAIRGTLLVATRPGPGRVAQLMPVPPISRRLWPQLMRRQLVALTAVIVLILGGLNLRQQIASQSWMNPSVTVLAVTATHQPTSTATQTAGNGEQSPIEPNITPRPAGTPIADLAAN